ncbi:MAG: leucine--tRNA ligase [Eubacteriales bacterium]|nr:leucine--tRNA ligase [Eubacteriales bacterium]
MAEYDFREVEKKWQQKWENEPSFRAVDFHPTKPKFYVLYEFFNISGSLHMGHLKGTVPADALARYKRLKGYNVLFPIGGDSFGLPAENAAIKTGIDPHDFVKKGMEIVLAQSKRIGLSFDWTRTFCTSDEDYYHWTQWIFLQLLKNGKAYKQKGHVNFCKNCKTVLSNEDSQGGKCDRCGNDVIQVDRDVWFLKMKEYSEKLLKNIDNIEMADNLKEAQRNWIGKSEGVELNLDVVDSDGNKLDTIKIFTTCIETVYGITYVVLAPEHKTIDDLQSHIQNMDEVKKYREQTTLKSEFDRISQVKDKNGCEVKGIFAVNPLNGKRVAIYLGDYVLANYGTGAVMAVPAHDQRDYEFAKVYNIPMIQVLEGDISTQAVEKAEYKANHAKMLNSDKFTGMEVHEAKQKITKLIEQMGVGRVVTNYKMQDWPFNRQRYWGEPFPVVFCDKCGVVALDEKDLPLVLPKTNDYLPNEMGDSPLSKIDSFVHTKCPKCGGDARRETDTMPNWAGSSWYWLRYCDPHNKNALADLDKLKYWGSVDCYTGGTEHITRHVLYAFFWQNFLYEIGAVPTRDPFKRKMGSGLILDDEGKKMSKSSKNGVSPIEVIDKYGADVARMHLHFLAGYEDNCKWTYKGIDGIVNFLDKVWKLQEIIKDGGVSDKHAYALNTLIKKVSEDYENLKLNTAISACMIFIKAIKEDGYITKEELRQFLICLNPLAPHMTSEIYEIVFGGDIANETFPEVDESKLVLSEIEIPVQVNGKLKGVLKVAKDISQEELLNIAKQNIDALKNIDTIKKVIFVPGKIFNVIV